ncbi:unnamed protein product [Penicillium viridicatum]
MSNPEQYTVGWICALETEYVAARAFLDRKHARPETLSPNDNNHYTLGEIGGHQVVIAVLPDGDYGTSSAAGVARDMLHSFPNIRFGLMVGIGGGAPTKQDIRLGDIVVSSSRGGRGGLLQYDFGKVLQGQEFHQTGFLNQPPPILRAAVSGLQAQYEEEGHLLKESIQTVLDGNKRLKRKYAQPPSEGDRLYESQFIHVPDSQASCAELCDDSKLILRPERTEDEDDPAIHYGLIASANRVIKNALFRDKLAVEQDVLCFEMEAAGLMNHFPCLVIRGICDYADSHKSKEWQGYAAMVAAAYAKDLLYQIVPQRVNTERKASEVLNGIQNQLEDVSKNVHDVHTITSGSARNINTMAQSLDLKELLVAEGAEFGTYMDQHEEECLLGTRRELLLNIEEWAVLPEGKCIFWLNGLAGTGKSTISRTVAKFFKQKGLLGASFFFKRGEGDRGNATRFFPTITKQLFTGIPKLRPAIIQAIRDNPGISAKQLKEQFDKLVLQPLLSLEKFDLQTQVMVIVIDALDECETDSDIRVILQLLPRVLKSKSVHIRVFVTSRPELPIRLGFKDVGCCHQDLILHEIPEPIIKRDISLFLEQKLTLIRKERPLPPDWPGNTTFQALVTMSVPLFIFAATICRLFEDHNLDPMQCLTEILKYQNRESKLGGTYLPVFDRLLDGYNEERQNQLVEDIREVVGTIILLESPLSVAALAELTSNTTASINARLNPFHSILNIPTDETKPVRLFHLSLRDFLLDPRTRRIYHPTTRKEFRFWVDDKEMNQKLTTYCLNVMRKKLKKNMCNLQSYGIERRDIDAKSNDHYLPPELQYSCRYWTHHLARSRDPMAQIDTVLTFLEEHFLHWVEVMSMLGVVSEVLGGVSTLQSAVQHTKDSGISKFLHDAKRFILRNCQIADIAPLQLYASGLIFAPKMAITRRNFERELPDWICRGPSVEDNWSTELQTLEGHSEVVYSVAFSQDGRLLASGSRDKTIKLWDPATGALKHTLEEHSDPVCSVAFSPDGWLLASGSEDKTIKLWDPATGALQHNLEGHSDIVESVDFSPDGRLLASGSHDQTVKLWDPATGALKHTLEEHSDPVYSVAFSPDGWLLASGSGDKTIKLWDPTTSVFKHTLEGHLASVRSVAFTLDGQVLASGSLDRTIKLWDPTTGALTHTLRGHLDTVESVSFSPDSRLLASGSHDQTVKLWDPATGVLKHTLEGYSNWFWSVTFSPDGQLLASGSHDQTIKLWDPATCALQHTLEGHPAWVRSVTFSPDSRLLVSGSRDNWDNIIKLWYVATGALKHTLVGQSARVGSVTFSPDSRLLVSSSQDSAIKLWDSTTGTLKHALEGHLAWVRLTTFSLDGQLLASGSYDKTIKLWDVATGALKHTLEGHSSLVESITFSLDSQLLASGSFDNTIKLWDIATGALKHTLEGHSDYVRSVAFSLDNQLLASGSGDKTIKLWDPATGALQHNLEGHSDYVRSVAFSPDSQLLASGSSDRTIKLWDLVNGAIKHTISTDAMVTEIEFHKNLPYLVTDRGSFNIPAWHENFLSSSSEKKIELSLQTDRWVAIKGRRELWLPPDYQPYSSTVKDGDIALGCKNGRVCMITFSI